MAYIILQLKKSFLYRKIRYIPEAINAIEYLNKKKICHIYSFGKIKSHKMTPYSTTRELFKLIWLVLSSETLIPIFFWRTYIKTAPIISDKNPIQISIFQLLFDCSVQVFKGVNMAFSILSVIISITSPYIIKNIVNIYVKKVSYSVS